MKSSIKFGAQTRLWRLCTRAGRGELKPVSAALLSTLLCAPLLTAMTLMGVSAPGIAQLSVGPAQTGSQLELNGNPSTGAWGQWGTAIGISDFWLSQEAGLNLADTQNAAQQPFTWFTPPLLTRVLFDRPVQNRFLDLDALGTLGWQAQIRGNTLQLNTLPAQVLSLRRARQPWGERWVVELDHPTPWRGIRAAGVYSLSLDATASDELLSTSRSISRQQKASGTKQALPDLQVLRQGNRINLNFQLAQADLTPGVTTLGSPPRLVIDLRPADLPTRDLRWAPGVHRRQQTLNLGNRSFAASWLAVDLKQPGVSLKPIWTNPQSQPGTTSVGEMARRWQAAAVINGGFFNRNNRLPLGAIRREGRWVSGPILNRAAIAWNDQGDIEMDRLSLQETVQSDNGSFALTNLNSGYVQAGLARYTTAWGAVYRPIIDNEVLITVENDRVVSQVAGGAAGQVEVSIPANGYLLVARGFQRAVNALQPGVAVEGVAKTTPGSFEVFPHVVGAGPLLVKNGQIVLNAAAESFQPGFQSQRADRSAIGRLDNGQIVLATFSNGPSGDRPTLGETAQLMQKLGAVDALNLDGGSSSALWLGGEMINRSPQTAARVHNGIGLFINLPAEPTEPAGSPLP
ncbi:phosphodiester glycosidase family protein [Leptolyngbya sp. FACHB-261]|uniref:phosphodiester glycosidase family protein n=1 Tax=Leptolyngbya sp. FACHB-261 TaxID=2692806 RepID=UPI0016866C4C|nr:phosphodiester glycosidase family protein [Leptolyngbya sp. FACHB-261]MBD2102452.1 phosphodiester glycosidase family protein [Leptolyngbya sp. FACHB-261]